MNVAEEILCHIVYICFAEEQAKDNKKRVVFNPSTFPPFRSSTIL